MRKFFKKINGASAALLCAAVTLGFTVDFGKYVDRDEELVDYSRYIDENGETAENEDVFAAVSLGDGEKLLYYTVNNRDMGYIQGETVQVLTDGEISSYVCAYANLNYRFVKWSDGSTEAKRRDVAGDNKEITAYFEYIGFPNIYITVADVKGEIGEEYVPSSITLSNAEERLCFENSSSKIRIRGNSSAKFDKKSFKIKFSDKVNMLGLGKADRKDWVLVANHCDQSLMRNYVSYSLAQSFEGFEVAYDCAHVNVYINGKYNGVYILTEQVETGKSRVDIETEGVNDDIGFLLELDSREKLDSGECIQIDGLRFAIKSDFTTNGQYKYAKDYLTKCNKAIKKGNKEEIEALVDIDSFVDMYLLQEYVKNFDVGFASLFMYIEENGGKLYFGPAWDFDISMGNDDRLEDGGFEELFTGERRGFGIGHEWFVCAMDQKWFRDLVKERYVELYPIIQSEISNSVKYYLANKSELEKNFDKWDILGDRIFLEPESIVANETYEEHFDHLIIWLEGRSKWLYDYYTSEEYENNLDSFFDRIDKITDKVDEITDKVTDKVSAMNN